MRSSVRESPFFIFGSVSVLALCAIFVGTVLAVPVLAAQTNTGIIDGVVRDPEGSPLPAVTVVANSPSLMQSDLTVYTNENGYYRLPKLPSGEYDVAFSLQGFQRVERSGLVVNAGQTTTVNISMSLATVEEQVTVTGESPTVDSKSAKLGFNYTDALMENIPTARDFHDLASTIPGVEKSNIYGYSPGNLKNESVLGAGPFGNRYEMDGVNITDPAISYNQANLFSYDIVQEVQVIKGAKPAEVGFTQGGFFNIVTKSGGNRFHGEGSVFYQEDGLQATNLDERLRSFGVTRSNALVDDLDATISAGGRFIRDRLWFYGSARRQDRTFAVLGFPKDLEDQVNAYFWKNTLQINQNHRISGTYNHWDQSVNFFFFGFPPSLAASEKVSMQREPGGDAVQFRWDGVLSDTVIADFSFGYNNFRLDQLFQPDATTHKRDLVTGMRFGNPGSGSRDHDSDNSDFSGAVSWFVPDAAGRHNVKFGAEYTHSPFTWGFDDVSDHWQFLVNGDPFGVMVLNTPVDAEWQQDFTSLYAQDDWTIKDRVTLNVGVRFDRIDTFAPEQAAGGGEFAGTALAERFPVLDRQMTPKTDLITWNSVAPRLSASVILDDDGDTVARGGYARYYHHLNSQQVWSANPNFPFFIFMLWSDPNADGAFQVGEEGPLLSLSGGRLVSIDPEIEHMYSDEFTAGVSHELFTDFSLNANFIYRKDQKLINTVDIGIPFSSYTPVEVTDPGPDGETGTADDGTLTVFAQDPSTFGESEILLTNPGKFPGRPPNERTYKAFELVANKRFSNDWQLVGSVVISEMEVIQPASNAGGAFGTLFRDPNDLINAKGLDPLNQTYQVKLQGTYRAPYGIMLSALYRYGSGFPFTRELVVLGLPQGPTTVFAEPRGSRETDSYNWIDIRAEKVLELSNGLDLGLMIDVFNLTNASTVLRLGSRTGVDLGTPRVVETPRIARFGARLTW